MMFFIPPAILAIEDEDDRSFMENLYRSYYRLMYHEIFTVTSDPCWPKISFKMSSLVSFGIYLLLKSCPQQG